MMKIIRGQEPFPKKVTKSIFLLGPIPRKPETKKFSWKKEAYRILEELGYNGTVYDPEHLEAPGPRVEGYDNAPQIDWEVKAMDRVDIIVAWIPREFPHMPAFTSNVELGEMFKTGRLVFGYPVGTERMDYLGYRAKGWLDKAYKWQVPVKHNLRETLATALELIGEGAVRQGAEAAIPLNLWRDRTFQRWYYFLKLGRHELADFKVEYVYYRWPNEETGWPRHRIWAMRPKVKVAGENRFKDNELVIGRPSKVAVLMYYPSKFGVKDYKVVLVKEYRPAVENDQGLVYELPSGSIEPLEGPITRKMIRDSAVQEVWEETDLKIERARLVDFDVRQTMATLVACETHVFTYELNKDEFELLTKNPDAGLLKIAREEQIAAIKSLLDVLDGKNHGPQ